MTLLLLLLTLRSSSILFNALLLAIRSIRRGGSGSSSSRLFGSAPFRSLALFNLLDMSLGNPRREAREEENASALDATELVPKPSTVLHAALRDEASGGLGRVNRVCSLVLLLLLLLLLLLFLLLAIAISDRQQTLKLLTDGVEGIVHNTVEDAGVDGQDHEDPKH